MSGSRPTSVLHDVNCDTVGALSTGSFRTVEESIDDETQLVAVHGDVDLKTAHDFRDAIEEAAREAKTRLIVDMSEVPFMDSSGLAALMSAQKLMRTDTHMVVVCPPNLQRIFEVTRLDSVLTIRQSLAEALVA